MLCGFISVLLFNLRDLRRCRESLCFQTQSYDQVEQNICLIILHADHAAHLKRLFLKPDTGHGNKDNQHQSGGESEVHDEIQLNLPGVTHTAQ